MSRLIDARPPAPDRFRRLCSLFPRLGILPPCCFFFTFIAPRRRPRSDFKLPHARRRPSHQDCHADFLTSTRRRHHSQLQQTFISDIANFGEDEASPRHARTEVSRHSFLTPISASACSAGSAPAEGAVAADWRSVAAEKYRHGSRYTLHRASPERFARSAELEVHAQK